MRIVHAGGTMGPPSNITAHMSLFKLMAERDILLGLVRRVTPVSAFLQFDRTEVEWPLTSFSKEQRRALVGGRVVELKRQDEQTFALKILAAPAGAEGEGKSLAPPQLEQVLVELNIPPTSEAVLVAQGLLDRGFAIQEELVWSLLPWAERGQLEEAFLLLQAKYPLRPELLSLVRQSRGRSAGDALHLQARASLPPDLQELFASPSWETRAKWSDRLSEGEIFKTLVRLLVEERLAESLINQQSGLSEYVFALPFLRNDDLYASWVRIARDDGSRRRAVQPEETSFYIELQMPSATLGIVGAELCVQGKDVNIVLRVEDEMAARVQGDLELLEQELATAGWSVTGIKVGGWKHAQSRSFTL